jgi:WD40 repeat protein
VLWDVNSGEILRRFGEHPGWTIRVAFAPDGHTAVSASGAALITWDVSNGMELSRIESTYGYIPALDGYITSLEFGLEDNIILTGADDGTIALWNSDNLTIFARLEGHSGSVDRMAYDPDTNILISATCQRKGTSSNCVSSELFDFLLTRPTWPNIID